MRRSHPDGHVQSLMFNLQSYNKVDRQITKEEKDLAKRKKLMKGGIAGGCIIVAGIALMSMMRTSVDREELTVSEVSRGTIEVSVTATGKVSPAIEEIINSPITTRIMEIYKRGGDRN